MAVSVERDNWLREPLGRAMSGPVETLYDAGIRANMVTYAGMVGMLACQTAMLLEDGRDFKNAMAMWGFAMCDFADGRFAQEHRMRTGESPTVDGALEDFKVDRLTEISGLFALSERARQKGHCAAAIAPCIEAMVCSQPSRDRALAERDAHVIVSEDGLGNSVLRRTSIIARSGLTRRYPNIEALVSFGTTLASIKTSLDRRQTFCDPQAPVIKRRLDLADEGDVLKIEIADRKIAFLDQLMPAVTTLAVAQTLHIARGIKL